MQYCVTIEMTQRTAVWFDADNDDEAAKYAEALVDDIDDDEFDDEREYNHAVSSEDGRTIVDWD